MLLTKLRLPAISPRPCFFLPSAAALAALALAAAPQAARAQLTFFTNRTTFTAANPGLLSENFETTTNGTNRVITGPISSTTAATTFLTVVPGITVQAVGTTGIPGSGSNQFFYNNGATFNTGNGTNVLTTNQAADSQDITFATNTITAYGVDLGSFNSSTYTISVYNTAGTLLGTSTSTPATNTFNFFGFTSTAAIGRVNIASPSFETTDNMLFGTAAISGSAAPEPISIALMLTGGAGMVGGIVRRRCREIA